MKNPVTDKDVSALNPGDFGEKPLRLSQFVEMLKFAQKEYGDRDPFVVFGAPTYEGEKWHGYVPNGYWDVDNLDAGYLILEDNTDLRIGEDKAHKDFGFLGNEHPENRKGFVRKK